MASIHDPHGTVILANNHGSCPSLQRGRHSTLSRARAQDPTLKEFVQMNGS